MALGHSLGVRQVRSDHTSNRYSQRRHNIFASDGGSCYVWQKRYGTGPSARGPGTGAALSPGSAALPPGGQPPATSAPTE
jgi:hypothetical protein